MNRSNELLLDNPYRGLPGFPVWETGLRFIQTHHNYIYRVWPTAKFIFARDRKTISIVIHLIAHLREQYRR